MKKLTYIISGLFASAMMLTSCADVDETITLDGVGSHQLSVKGFLVSNPDVEYPSIVDPENGTITVQVPYYISDTQPIMGDLTQMKVEAQLPVGYTFKPSISGIHDLTEGVRTNLYDANGKSQPYTIVAQYVKSSAASILSAKLVESERTMIVVTEPEAAGANGKVAVFKTSSSVEAYMHAAAITVSPWATVECSAMDPVTGYIDFSKLPEITVIAQDGTRVKYNVALDYPKIKEEGMGYTAALWGYQLLTDNEYGFETDANTSMAVIGDDLIISNRFDVNKMIVLNRYTGLPTGKKVNTTGLPTDREFRAICNDDAGHLVAATFTSTLDATVTDPNVRIFVWKDGIESAPTGIVWANINGTYFQGAPMGINNVTKLEMFSTISVKGDITSGNAVLGTSTKNVPRCVLMQFTDGKPDTKAFVEWAGGTVSMWNATKCIPLTTEPPYGYIWNTANFRSVIVYNRPGTGSRGFDFNLPTTHFWNNGTYGKHNLGLAYCEFNGMNILATSNGNSSNIEAQRLWLSNIGPNPTASSLQDGFLFDSREGHPTLGTAAISGTGYAVTGMTSKYPFAGGTVLGPDAIEMGDVIFARSDDGNAIQVYLLTTDHGIFCYEITRFDI